MEQHKYNSRGRTDYNSRCKFIKLIACKVNICIQKNALFFRYCTLSMSSVFLFLTFYFLFSTFNCSAQDIHFSQFYNSPLILSPGLTGVFDGDLRVVGNQRSQWSSVTTPYATFGVAIDANTIYNTPINVGLGFYNDKTGDSQLSTLQIAPSVSYTYFIGDSSQTITLGVQPTFTQKTINYNQLRFDNQYNGVSYDQNLSNNETFSNEGRTYLNVHSGLSWDDVLGERKSIGAGIALHNIFNPKQSFFNNNAIELNKRFTFYAECQFKITEKIDGLPRISIMTQDRYKEIIFGGSGKYYLNNANYKAVYLGFWYRNSDATYVTAELDYSSFHFGVSYDINLSSLRVASHNRGGFEFSIIYIYKKFRPTIKHYKACPNYI